MESIETGLSLVLGRQPRASKVLVLGAGSCYLMVLLRAQGRKRGQLPAPTAGLAAEAVVVSPD